MQTKIQQKPSSWTCLATSFAMAFDMKVEDLFARVGHDGSAIVDPHVSDPARRRGHHPQEFVDVALSLGLSLTYVELLPLLQFTSGRQLQVDFRQPHFQRFGELIRKTRGVVMGVTPSRFQHAMAYESGQFFDPDTASTFAYSPTRCEDKGFYTRCLYIVSSKETTPL